MLWTIAIVLFVLWLLGVLAFKTCGWWIHLLLVIAVIVILYNLFTGHRAFWHGWHSSSEQGMRLAAATWMTSAAHAAKDR